MDSTTALLNSIPLDSDMVLVSYTTLRGILIMEQMYIERGIVIDSLYKIVGNCEEIGLLTARAFERERVGFQACEVLNGVLLGQNKQLRRDLTRSKAVNYILGVAVVGTVTYIVVKNSNPL